MLDRVRGFTYARQRLGRAAPDAASALRDVVAVYSSHPSAPLALHARCAQMAPEDFRAVAAGALRIPGMRGSIHADLRAQLLAAAIEPRSQQELVAAVGADAQAVKGATAAMTREGSMVRVGAPGLRSNALRYQARQVEEVEQDAALAWLTGEYLRTLGPARREDVAWWLGTSRGRADAALVAHPTLDVGEGLLLRAEDEEAFAADPAPRGVDLLGKWDPLTMGHAPDGRGRCGMEPRCYDFRGDGLPVVLADGVALGTWSMTAKGKRLELGLDLFEAPGPRLRKAIEQRADEVTALLA